MESTTKDKDGDNNMKSHTVLFRFSDMVEAVLAYVPFSVHQYYHATNQIPCSVPSPKLVEVGVPVPSNEKSCGYAGHI